MKINCVVCSESCKACHVFESKNCGQVMRLCKKKVTKHYVPPDMTALKMLCENDSSDASTLSENELEELKKQILSEIKTQL